MNQIPFVIHLYFIFMMLNMIQLCPHENRFPKTAVQITCRLQKQLSKLFSDWSHDYMHGETGLVIKPQRIITLFPVKKAFKLLYYTCIC